MMEDLFCTVLEARKFSSADSMSGAGLLALSKMAAVAAPSRGKRGEVGPKAFSGPGHDEARTIITQLSPAGQSPLHRASIQHKFCRNTFVQTTAGSKDDLSASPRRLCSAVLLALPCVRAR